jgi:putative ABC transport system ATP-binding protein
MIDITQLSLLVFLVAFLNKPGKNFTMSKPIFYAKDLKKSYRMGELEVQALRGVNLELYPNEFIVLLGPSGSGKSTLLNILGGLDSPTSGTVMYLDHNLVMANPEQLTLFSKEHVGFVFQFFNLIPNLTAQENVELATDLVAKPMSALDALTLVGLQDRKDHFPSQLSGGEQQRVAIARAIAKRPDILLCDEPTGALDVKTGKLVLEAINKVNQELGTLVVVITHNAAIANLADRVIILSDGQISQIKRNDKKITVDEVIW